MQSRAVIIAAGVGLIMGSTGLLPRPQRRELDAGPIGSWKRRHVIAVSTIRLDDDKRTFVYGDEVEADLAFVTHDLLRKSLGQTRKVAFTRQEIRIAAGASRDIKGGGNLFLSEMPAGQRRVHKALIQTYPRNAPPQCFEDYHDLPEDLADPKSRDALRDDQAIAVLQELRVNPFETGKVLVASFVSNSAGTFATYDDENRDEPAKRRETKLRLADATYSIGAVAESDEVEAAIWQDGRITRVFDLAGDGRLKVKSSATSPETKIDLEVGSRAADHLAIAIRQAMAGAGEKAAGLVGSPVAVYAKWLFERHLCTAQERFSGRIPPMDAFDPNDLNELFDGNQFQWDP